MEKKPERKQKITEQEFMTMKTIRENNPKMLLKQIGEIVGVSANCVSTVLNCGSWEEYEEKKAEWRKYYHGRKQTEPQKPTENKTSNNYQLNRIYDQLHLQNETLMALVETVKECSRLLAMINEQWM